MHAWIPLRLDVSTHPRIAVFTPTDVLPVLDIVTDDPARVVRRSHWLRALGLSLGGMMVGVTLYRVGVGMPIWTVWALYAFAWPHVAWLILRRCREPVALDRMFFVGDAAMCGIWIALMQFNMLPSAVIVTMLAITLIAIDGWQMLGRGMLALVTACFVAMLANGLAFAPDTMPLEVLASLPLLVVFPMTLGVITHDLNQRVRMQNLELLRMGSIDSLSGLLNRRHWEDAVNNVLECGDCDDAVMLLVDIDHFKQVNDLHGHTVGDEVIRKVGAIVRENLRKGDVAGRYGGDEFCLVLCGMGVNVAATVAERIRVQLAGSLTAIAPDVRCTLSVGVAPRPATRGSIRDWVKVADAALYRAKLAGRDRLAVAM